MERDENGRFAKGNTIGKDTRIKKGEKDRPSKGGVATVKAERKRKAVAELVAAYMEQPSGEDGRTRLDDYVERGILGTYRKKDQFGNGMDLRDIKLLQDILGEDVKTLNINHRTDGEDLAENLLSMLGDRGQN